MQLGLTPFNQDIVHFVFDADHELYEIECIEVATQTPYTGHVTCPTGMTLEQLVALLQTDLLQRMHLDRELPTTKAAKANKGDKKLILEIRSVRKVGTTLFVRSIFDESILPF